MKKELTADYADGADKKATRMLLHIRAIGVIRGSKRYPIRGIRGIILGIAVCAGVCVFDIRMDSRTAFLIMAAMTGHFTGGLVTSRPGATP